MAFRTRGFAISWHCTEQRQPRRFDGPRVRQFSVFLKNKVGALLEVVRLLNLHARGRGGPERAGFDGFVHRAAGRQRPGSGRAAFSRTTKSPSAFARWWSSRWRRWRRTCAKLLASLLAAEVNIYFSYPLLTRPNGRAALAMHVEDHECAASVLAGDGFKLLSQADISR